MKSKDMNMDRRASHTYMARKRECMYSDAIDPVNLEPYPFVT